MGKEDELENWGRLKYRMRDEGVNYCFVHYSNWSEIKDEEFHKKRLTYLNVVEDLETYIHSKIIELDGDPDNY